MEKCKVCVEPYLLYDLIPKQAQQFMEENDLYLGVGDEADFDNDAIVLPDYAQIEIDKNLLADYLVYNNEIEKKEDIDNYLDSIYLSEDFDDLPDWLEEFHNLRFLDYVINQDTIIDWILHQIRVKGGKL